VATMLLSSAEDWAKSVPAAYVALASRRSREVYLGNGYDESATFFRKVLNTSEDESPECHGPAPGDQGHPPWDNRSSEWVNRIG